MISEIELRPVDVSDTNTVASHRYFSGADKASLERYSSWLHEAIQSGRYFGMIAQHKDGFVVGGAGIVCLEWGPTLGSEGAIRGRIANLFVQDAYRRQGIGRQLIRKVMEQARTRGIVEFCLAATPAAVRIYESVGFRKYEAEMVLKAQ
jgi:GNAT superfamily N-acetyltransferase